MIQITDTEPPALSHSFTRNCYAYRKATILVQWKEGVDRSVFVHNTNWWYYVFLYERHCKSFEPELWLPDEIKRFSEEGSLYISHDYMRAFNDIDFHCGITFYAKHGQVKGFRSVELGCDYQHYWDEGIEYRLENVLREARNTADQLVDKYYEATSFRPKTGS